MSDIFIANAITSIFLLLTVLLITSLAEDLPADFMNRNYTGATIKPKPAAQFAFLTITVTLFSMFFVWSVTPSISQYYDYLLANLLPLLGIWWLFSLFSAVILKQIQKESIRWIVAIGLVTVIGFGFFAPSIKSISLGFLTNLNPLQGTVTEKNSSTSKYGSNYTVTIDDVSYKVTRSAYAEFSIGEAVEVFHTEFRNMVFPIQHVNSTWFGIILLVINLLSIMGAIAVIAYNFISKEEKL
ncbi:MAG: hypothetical protein JNK81_11085 [Anaerolineales bacterium]|nr:hypothetical protein [Anaerolineales bacterium]